MSDELHLVCNDCRELKYACRCGNGEAELENYRQKKVLKLCHEARELCKESPLAAPAGSAPGNWYKAYEMEDLLKASPVPQVSDNYDFCIWLSGHMNLALQKGYEMAEGKAQNSDSATGG